VELGEFTAFAKHAGEIRCNYRSADVAIDQIANAADLFRERAAFFCDQRRVGGDAIDDVPGEGFFDLVEIGCI